MGESNGKFLLPITFHPITDKILAQLKVLNGVIFPIKYQVMLLPRCFGYCYLGLVCPMHCAAWASHRGVWLWEQEKVYRDCLLFKDLTQGGVHHFRRFHARSAGAATTIGTAMELWRSSLQISCMRSAADQA